MVLRKGSSLLCNISFCQEITFTEILNWINNSNYPVYMFQKLENKNFTFYKNSQFLDCTEYIYSSPKNSNRYACFVVANVCDSKVALYSNNEVTRRFEIHLQDQGSNLYNYLIEKIKFNCTLVKKEKFELKEHYDFASEECIYKHNSGIYFSFYSVFDRDCNCMGYFINAEK